MDEAENFGGLPISKTARGRSSLLIFYLNDPNFTRSARLVQSHPANSKEKQMLDQRSSSSGVSSESESDANHSLKQ